jgi:hypothetical protein
LAIAGTIFDFIGIRAFFMSEIGNAPTIAFEIKFRPQISYGFEYRIRRNPTIVGFFQR